jgi:hypothetical protein
MAVAANTKFGIKEVADVEFYLFTNGTPATTPTLKFDTLKVSNLEFTSEEAAARGGKGNPKLITWDYNREVTLTLQDALLSMESLAAIFGDSESSSTTSVEIGADTYPGYYQIKGQTFAKTTEGETKLFKFEIPKAKISSNVTLTMEAEGDPTVFDMTLTVLQHTTGTGESAKKEPLVKLELADA